MKLSALSHISYMLLCIPVVTAISNVEAEVLYTRSLLPDLPLADIYDYAQHNLAEDHPLVQDLYNHITIAARSIKEKRMASPFALPFPEAIPEPKGGGGLKGAGSAAKKAGSGNGSNGGTNPPPPGLSADGMKAWNQCQAASNTGDCGAMKGMFATMGCTLGNLHGMKACENGNVQEALKKKYCAEHKGGKFC